MASYRNLHDLDELVKSLALDFNRIFSFIYSEYTIYSQFNGFIWTVVILQFILIRSKLHQESGNLNVVINMIMSESNANELSQLIQCFDIVNSLFEQSQCEANADQVSEFLNATPIYSRIVNLNIGGTDDKDLLKDLNNCTSGSTTIESRNLSDMFHLREDYHSEYILSNKKPTQVHASEICIENYEEDLELTLDKGHNRNISGIDCFHTQSISHASDFSCNEELDVESDNYSNNLSNTLLKRSKTVNDDYCSKHQSSSILKVMKRNSITKPESVVAEDAESNYEKSLNGNSICEVTWCRRKLLRLSLTKSKKKKE